MIGRWRNRRAQDRHARLIEDIERTRGLMRAVVADARGLDVAVPSMVVVSIAAWGEWLDHLETPIEEDR